jgi:leader peptidase (prepilin peptidase)/N-methyltransferase
MLIIGAYISLLSGFITLCCLSYIDFKTRLLPNIGTASLALLGLFFQIFTNWYYVSVENAFLGALIGFGSLYILRLIANSYYGKDALGLGDVKLMGAAGIWLGADYITLALLWGALAGLCHGALYMVYMRYKMHQKISLSQLQIPAGPGFAAGICITAIWLFRAFIF